MEYAVHAHFLFTMLASFVSRFATVCDFSIIQLMINNKKLGVQVLFRAIHKYQNDIFSTTSNNNDDNLHLYSIIFV